MKLQKITNHDIYEITIHHAISKEDIEHLSDAFDQFKERGEKINLLGIFESFPTLDSLLSISAMFKMKFKSLSIINKYAIVADQDWIEKLIPVANFLTPSMPIKAFDDDEKNEAIEWLSKEETKEYQPEEYLTGVDIEKINDNSYTISLNNKRVDHASMAALNSILDNLDTGEKINLLIYFEEFPSIESFRTFYEGLKVDLKALRRLNKYAVVTDGKWINSYAKIGDFLTPGIDVKAFTTVNMQEAKEWLTA